MHNMTVIKKILVAVGNESSLNRCLSLAIPIAKGIGASITCIYVLSSFPRNLQIALERSSKKEKEHAEKYFEIAKEKCTENGIKFEQIIAKGQAREEILEHEKEFDLIVIGRADWGSKILGSISNGVVSQSKKNILLVK
jgi:nucleotide-binding universal stress UspA family protein